MYFIHTREIVQKLETTMATPIAATLHVALQTAQVYRVLYTISDEGGGAATPYSLHGQATLRACLKALAIPANDIDMIMTRVESGISYVLDLGHLDKAKVEKLLLRYAGS